MFEFLEWIAQKLSRLTNRIEKLWEWLSNGPLQTFFFYLILLLTGILVIFRAIFEELDRLLANIEKALISIALLIMVGLCFLDYLRREFDTPLQYLEREFHFPDLEINGGMTMQNAML